MIDTQVLSHVSRLGVMFENKSWGKKSGPISGFKIEIKNGAPSQESGSRSRSRVGS